MGNKILIINHVFWPDQHNTARHITELAFELKQRGWNVTALISNRSYINHKKTFTPKKGKYNGINYIRAYVPPLNQKKNSQRLLTSLWLIVNWIGWLPKLGKFDAIIIGTNPPFVYFITPFLKLFKPKAKLLMWGFDLYPEAIMALGGSLWKFLGSIIKPYAKVCFNKLDMIVDIGPCMRERYREYNHSVQEATLPPWSFVEPKELSVPHQPTRKELFGDAKLTLLYSGTLGNAHEYDNFIVLARELRKRNTSVGFCFAGFGNRFNELKSEINESDTNISFGGFVETDEELEQRLSSADIMLISLKDEWTGISVPSKYFGALASGKAVLFSGSSKSALSIWTKKYKSGFQLSIDSINDVADMLEETAKNPSKVEHIKRNAFVTYQNHFSKKAVCDGWSKLLKELIKDNE